MTRYYRRYNYYNDDYTENPIGGLIVLGLFYLLYKYYTDRTIFWHWVLYGIAGIIFLILLYIIIKIIHNKRDHKIAMEMVLFSKDIKQMVESAKKENAVKTSNNPTPQARALHDALVARGIECELEPWDGHKHVDLGIPRAKINIEIDGNQHYLDPKQITADFNRSYYSMRNGVKTIRYPNFIIDTNLNKVVDGIVRIVQNEHYKN